MFWRSSPIQFNVSLAGFIFLVVGLSYGLFLLPFAPLLLLCRSKQVWSLVQSSSQVILWLVPCITQEQAELISFWRVSCPAAHASKKLQTSHLLSMKDCSPPSGQFTCSHVIFDYLTAHAAFVILLSCSSYQYSLPKPSSCLPTSRLTPEDFWHFWKTSLVSALPYSFKPRCNQTPFIQSVLQHFLGRCCQCLSRLHH